MRNSYELRGDRIIVTLGRRDGKPMECAVDYTDLKLLQSLDCRWIAQNAVTSPTSYAVALIGSKREKRQKVYMHRFLTQAGPGTQVDHRDHDGLNNCRSNLRVGDRFLNQQNRRGPRKGSRSGISNISWSSTISKWEVRAMRNGHLFKFGSFASLAQAQDCLMKKVSELVGSIREGK